ncbi:MAG: hypothetical protein R3F38_06140 [Gammaproteobacteria bacterium]
MGSESILQPLKNGDVENPASRDPFQPRSMLLLDLPDLFYLAEQLRTVVAD